MLQPKKRKYRKEFRGTIKGPSTRGLVVAFGDFGLKAAGSGLVTQEQLESARRTITHHTKRVGKLWLRVFPHKPTTKKAAGSKMGSGKGDIDTYKAVIRRGTILFELGSVPKDVAREAFRKAASKLPLPTLVVERGVL